MVKGLLEQHGAEILASGYGNEHASGRSAYSEGGTMTEIEKIAAHLRTLGDSAKDLKEWARCLARITQIRNEEQGRLNGEERSASGGG